MPSIGVFISKLFYDRLYLMVDNRVLSEILFPLILLTVYRFSGFVTGIISDRYIDLIVPDKLSNILTWSFFEKSMNISYSSFDNDEYYNGLSRAKNVAQNNRAYRYVVTVFRVIGFSIEIVGSAAALMLINPLLFLIALLSVLPITVLRLVHGKFYFTMKQYQTERENEEGYLWSLISSKEVGREFRIFGSNQYMIDKWMQVKEELCDEENRFTRKSAGSQF